MKNGIAAALALAGLAWLSDGHAQTEGLQQVDAQRGRVWTLAGNGVGAYEFSTGRWTKLVLPGWHWAGAPYGSPPVLAVGPKGEAIITSDIASTLWRIDPDTLAVTLHALSLDADTDKDVGFSALAYSREHDAFVGVSGMLGSVWMIDRDLARARKVQSTPLQSK